MNENTSESPFAELRAEAMAKDPTLLPPCEELEAEPSARTDPAT